LGTLLVVCGRRGRWGGAYMGGCQSAFELKSVSQFRILVSSRSRLSKFSVSRAGNFPKQPERGGFRQTGSPRNLC
jgi:hypothetical protein